MSLVMMSYTILNSNVGPPHCLSPWVLFCKYHGGGVIVAISIHSLQGNSIGDDGAKAIAEVMKKMTNLQQLL